MAGNRAVIFAGPGKVEVVDLDYPRLEVQGGPGVSSRNVGRKTPHGVILKTLLSNICGSDQHMVRGRTAAPEGLVLGHEVTGQIVEKGPDVEFLDVGDIVSVPFNVACGRCRNCKEGKTAVCLGVNPDRPGSAYGYVDMGGWPGGQAEYAMVPYADWNCLKFPDREQALDKIRDLAMLPDVFPTGYHGCVTAGVTTGSTVYIAGAGPVGIAAAVSAQLLGAAVVIVGDINPDRLAQAYASGCEVVDVSLGDPKEQIEQILGLPEVDCGIDAVGFEAHGLGAGGLREQPATVLNSLMDITRAGGALGIPGLYVTDDPSAVDATARHGSLSLRIGLSWAKSHAIFTGQCPVMKYNHRLMMAILSGRVQIARALNATVIPLEAAPPSYHQFDQGEARTYMIDPHGLIPESPPFPRAGQRSVGSPATREYTLTAQDETTFEIVRIPPDAPGPYRPDHTGLRFYYIELARPDGNEHRNTETWRPERAYSWLAEHLPKVSSDIILLAVVGSKDQLGAYPYWKLGAIPYIASEGWKEKLRDLLRPPIREDELNVTVNESPPDQASIRALEEHGRRMGELGAPEWVLQHEPENRFD
ncbi:formaldehyde dehydrogenase, glutathione-independent [Geodermatophilus sp. SYSU D01176]